MGYAKGYIVMKKKQLTWEVFFMKKDKKLVIAILLVLTLTVIGLCSCSKAEPLSVKDQILAREVEQSHADYDNIIIHMQTDFEDARIVLYTGEKNGVRDEQFGTAVFYKNQNGEYQIYSWGMKGGGFRFVDFQANGQKCYAFCSENADGRVAKLRVELMTGGELSFDVPEGDYYILIASPEQNNGAEILPKAEYFYAADGTLVTENVWIPYNQAHSSQGECASLYSDEQIARKQPSAFCRCKNDLCTEKCKFQQPRRETA